MGFTANTVRASAYLRRELGDIGIVANPAKTVVLPLEGHARTAEEISLLASVDVRISEKEGVTMVGVLIGTEEHVVERTVGVVKDEGAAAWHVASLACRISKRRPTSPSNLSVRRQAALSVSPIRVYPSKHEEGRQRGAVGIRASPRATGGDGGTTRSSEYWRSGRTWRRGVPAAMQSRCISNTHAFAPHPSGLGSLIKSKVESPSRRIGT